MAKINKEKKKNEIAKGFIIFIILSLSIPLILIGIKNLPDYGIKGYLSLIFSDAWKTVWDILVHKGNNEIEINYDEGFFAAAAFLLGVIAAVTSYISYRENKKKTEQDKKDEKAKQETEKGSDFLYNATHQFVNSTDHFTKVYGLLDTIYHYSIQSGKYCKNSPYTKEEFDKADKELAWIIQNNFTLISNYLSFFEMFSIHINTFKLYPFSILNNLFNFRFHLAVRNSRIREVAFIERPSYFSNDLELKEKWECWKRITPDPDDNGKTESECSEVETFLEKFWGDYKKKSNSIIRVNTKERFSDAKKESDDMLTSIINTEYEETKNDKDECIREARKINDRKSKGNKVENDRNYLEEFLGKNYKKNNNEKGYYDIDRFSSDLENLNLKFFIEEKYKKIVRQIIKTERLFEREYKDEGYDKVIRVINDRVRVMLGYQLIPIDYDLVGRKLSALEN